MNIRKYRYFSTCIILFLSFNSYGSEIDIANKIIDNQFPSYRLALEKDYNTELIYGEWGKNQGVTLAPQSGDFNNDSVSDLVFFVVKREPFKKIKISGKEYNMAYVMLLSCHGTTQSGYNCFNVMEEDTIHPLQFFHSVINTKKTECPLGSNQFVEGPAISVNPALGRLIRIYWFIGNKYHRCVYGV